MSFPACISAGTWDWNRGEAAEWRSPLFLLSSSTPVLLSVTPNSLLPFQKRVALLTIPIGHWAGISDSWPAWRRILNLFSRRPQSLSPLALISIYFSLRFRFLAWPSSLIYFLPP